MSGKHGQIKERSIGGDMKRSVSFLVTLLLIFVLTGCGQEQGGRGTEENDGVQTIENAGRQGDNMVEHESEETTPAEAPEGFVLIEGGTFQMGSPESEAWRSEDETQHSVTVSDFYMSRYELTQAEYEAVMGENPSNFSGGDLPAENMTWLEAVAYCNGRSEQEGLTPAYDVEGQNVSWNRSADGYRLPTEAE